MLTQAETSDFKTIILDIADMPWHRLGEADMVDAAWAYYYFSIQFRESLQVTAALLPDDEKLQVLVAEECATSNLSPFAGVAAPGETMDHDEFMKRALALAPIAADRRARFDAIGQRYLRATRAAEPLVKAMSIASYEDGGLESVFRAILTAHHWDHPVLAAFKHFLEQHIQFDSDPDQGHGALSRHLNPDDRIIPVWAGFRQLFIDFVPALDTVR